MTPQGRVALGVASMSVVTAAVGLLLVRAGGGEAPLPPRPPEIAGRVVRILTEACGTKSRPRTCSRPEVEFARGGTPERFVSRNGYRSGGPRMGDAVGVIVETDGTAWLAGEWDDRRARAEDELQKARFPRTMGFLVLGGAGFGLLLALGLVFFVDRGAHEPLQ